MQVEPWRLIPIDTSRGMSRNRELHHPCYMLVDFRAFRSFGLRPHGVMEVVLGQEEFSFPTVLPVAVNVVSLGEFLAPWLLTGLPGLQCWINGDLVGLALIACQEGFFLQVQVWCGPTLKLSGYPCPSGGDMACSGSPRKQRNNDLDLSRCCTAIRCSGGPSVAPPPLLWGRGYLLPSQTS